MRRIGWVDGCIERSRAQNTFCICTNWDLSYRPTKVVSTKSVTQMLGNADWCDSRGQSQRQNEHITLEFNMYIKNQYSSEKRAPNNMGILLTKAQSRTDEGCRRKKCVSLAISDC